MGSNQPVGFPGAVAVCRADRKAVPRPVLDAAEHFPDRVAQGGQGQRGEGDVRVQTRRTLENVKAILEAGGSSVEDVLMFRVYLTTRDDFAAMNEVYGEFIKENVPSGALPSRTTVFVDLPHEVMLVEIDALAVTG